MQMRNKVSQGILIVSSALCFSCATTEGISVTNPGSGTEELSEGSMSVSIPVPVKKERNLFSALDSRIIDFAYDGSPASIQKVVTLVNTDRNLKNPGYSEAEATLLFICRNLMDYVWTKDSFSFSAELPDLSNVYTGIISSVENDMYAPGAGGSEFFGCLLPSLLVVKPSACSKFSLWSEKSLSDLASALERKPDSVVANYLMGRLKFHSGEYESALTYFETALSGAPSSLNIAVARCDCLCRLGKMDEAEKIASELYEKNSYDVDVLVLCARCAVYKNDLDRSRSYVSCIMQQNPDNAQAMLLRARIYYLDGDYVKSSSMLDAYRSKEESYSNYVAKAEDYYILRANLLLNWKKDYREASRTMEEALSLYPDSIDVLLLSAQVVSRGKFLVSGLSALDFANLVLVNDPGNRTAKEICMQEYVKARNWEKAYEYSREFVENDDGFVNFDQGPGLLKALSDHVNICLGLGKFDEARAAVDSVYESNAAVESVQQMHIKVMIASGRKEEADELIDSLMKSSSSRMKSFLYYQKTFIHTDSRSVQENLRLSLTANPRNEEALFDSYSLYYGRKEYRKAQYYIKQLVALESSSNELYRILNGELDSLLGK